MVARHGDRLYTASNNQTVRRWSLPPFARTTPAAAADAHPHAGADSSDHASTQPGQWLWELPGEPKSTAISPNASLVAVGFGNGTLRLYGLPDVGWAKQSLPIKPISETPDQPNDGRIAEPLAEVVDAHTTNIKRIAFSPDGSQLATASMDNTAKLWALEQNENGLSLRLLHTLTGHTDVVHAVAFSPNGQTLATAGYDGRVGILAPVAQRSPTSAPQGGGAGGLPREAYTTESSELPLTFIEQAHKGKVGTIAFNNKGDLLMSAGEDSIVRLWNLTTTPPSLARELPKAQDMLLWAALRPDGREVAAVGRNAVIKLHNLDTPESAPRPLVGHEQTVYRAIYTPDGRQLATVSWDMTVRLWDLAQVKELFTLRLPTEFNGSPLWDFDLRCTEEGDCWIAVPLTVGRLALYRLPYTNPPE